MAIKRFCTILGISGCLVTPLGVYAQLIKIKTSTTKQTECDWYNCSFEKDSVYGACVNDAYEYAKNKKKKAHPVVALIGTGMDTEHEALKSNLWNNPKEKKDDIDNDKNGHVDDIHGWNFLGGPQGQVMSALAKEADREFLRLRNKYGDIIKDGNRYYTFVDQKAVPCPQPENMEEFNYYYLKILNESRMANAYRNRWIELMRVHYAQVFDNEIRRQFPEKEKILVSDILEFCRPSDPQDSSLRSFFLSGISITSGMNKVSDWEEYRKTYMSVERFNQAVQSYEKQYSVYESNERKRIVGDNYLDMSDKSYGNNVFLTADGMKGTMAAGIIAGKRGIMGRNNPIAENAEIMSLVVLANNGEPYLKDLALAIHYAIDHDASIIVLPQQTAFYPENQKDWISKALRRAERHGILVIVPVPEHMKSMNQPVFYPNRQMDGEKEMTHLLTVAASDKQGNPTSTTDTDKNELDIYAPGTRLLSTAMGDTYRTDSGPELAAATVAGVAALIKTYYPNLTGRQLRSILLQSATRRDYMEVPKVSYNSQRPNVDLIPSNQLCLAGGIVNALKALKAAEELTPRTISINDK